MIVLDEQLADARIVAAVERWYRGKVINILEVRPNTRVLDDVIGVLLQRLKDLPSSPSTTMISGARLTLILIIASSVSICRWNEPATSQAVCG